MPLTPPSATTILGAGALGRLWAAALGRHGQTCQFITRDADAKPTHFQFSDLATPHLPQREIHVAAATSAPLGLVLVTTKAQDTGAALCQHAHRFGPDTALVLFQNGMGSQDEVLAAFPSLAVLAAVSTEGAYRPSADTLVHAGHGTTRLGAMNAGGESALAGTLATLSASPLNVVAERSIRPALWRKLMINAMINPFTALLNCPNGEILDSELFVSNAPTLSTELARVATANGVVCDAAQVMAQAVEVAHATSKNISSMLQDVRAGRATEIDFINGYVARTGRALGIDCPINATLTQRVHALSRKN